MTSGSKDPSAVAAELQCLSESYEQEGCLPFAQWIISRSAATELQDMVADARFLVIAGYSVEWRSPIETTMKEPGDDRRRSLTVLSQATLYTISGSIGYVFYRSHGLVNQVSSF